MAKNLLKVLIPVIVIAAALVVLKSSVKKSEGPSAQNELKVGATVPDFEITDLDGGKTSFSKINAKVTLVNFWATWCDACVVEMPSIVKLRNQFKDKGFEVVLISVDSEPKSVVPSFLQHLGVDFKTYVDEGEKLSMLFDVRGIPRNIIINKDRGLLFQEDGERDWNSAEVHKQIEQWLAL